MAVELDEDHMGVLKFAEQNGGHLTYSEVKRAEPKYADQDRFTRAIDKLIGEGMAWEDSQNPSEIAYWFPSLIETSTQEVTQNIKDLSL